MNFLDIKRKLLPTSGYLMGGGGSSGGGGGTNTTVTNSNIPAYAQPYVESMLGATQSQIFTGPNGGPLTKNAEGNYEIGGFQPYRAYGGTYDAAGKQTKYDPSLGIAGFSPLQVEAQTGIKGLKTPTEFTNALTYTKNAADAAALPANKYATNTYANSYVAPTKADLTYTADTYGGASAAAPTDATSQGYTAEKATGDTAVQATLDQTKIPTAVGQTTDYKAGVVNPKTGIRSLERFQMGDPDQVSTKSFTDTGTAASYMSPYTTNVTDIQQRRAQELADIAATQQQGAATKAGAFGGSRDAIMRAEAAKNLALQKGDIEAQGLQAAYQQAQQQFNAEQGYGLQGQIANQQAGLTQGQQNLGANLGVQQLDTQTGLQTSLANLSNLQQAEMANKALTGQYAMTQAQMDQQAKMQTSAQKQQAALQNAAAMSQASQFGSAASNQAQLANRAAQNQMAQYNASNLQQAGLAGAAAKNQANQFNAGQNLTSAQTAAQYGLGANQLTEQSKQYGAGNELNRLQTQLQAGNQYGQLANQQLAATQGILGMQSATGAQQQANQQQINNQAMQDYANAQQYPMMQLGTMSNMLRGLPMQAQNTSMYTAQPNFATQAIGTTGALMNYPYQQQAPRSAEGGVVRKASGGLASIPQYDVGGSVRSKLENMTTEDLEDYLEKSDSRAIKQMAQAILREKMGMAGGGIIAFREGDPVNEEIARAYNAPRETPRDVAAQRAAPNPRAITAVPTQAPSLTNFDEEQKLINERQAEYTTQRAKADRPQSAFIAEIQAGRKELGLDQNEALATQRANVMAEKASLKDEAEYKRKMTLVKFFAAWGSTPGDTLIAGMKQFEKTIPEMVQNSDDEKKAKKETDKVIYELDNAVRLEKMGLYNEATASKNKAAELANAIQEQVRKSQEAMLKARQEAAKTTAEIVGRGDVAGIQAGSAANVAGIQAKSAANVAGIGAAGQFANASATRDATKANLDARLAADEKNKEIGGITTLNTQLEKINSEFERSKAMPKGAYYNAYRIIGSLERQEKLDDAQKKRLESNKQIITNLEAAHATRINGIQQKLDVAIKKAYGIDPVSRNPAAPPADFVLDK